MYRHHSPEDINRVRETRGEERMNDEIKKTMEEIDKDMLELAFPQLVIMKLPKIEEKKE